MADINNTFTAIESNIPPGHELRAHIGEFHLSIVSNGGAQLKLTTRTSNIEVDSKIFSLNVESMSLPQRTPSLPHPIKSSPSTGSEALSSSGSDEESSFSYVLEERMEPSPPAHYSATGDNAQPAAPDNISDSGALPVVALIASDPDDEIPYVIAFEEEPVVPAAPVAAEAVDPAPVVVEPTAAPVVAEAADPAPVVVEPTAAPVVAEAADPAPVVVEPAAAPVAAEAADPAPVVVEPAAAPVATEAADPAPVVVEPAAAPVAAEAADPAPVVVEPAAAPVATEAADPVPVVVEPAAAPVAAEAADPAPVVVEPAAAPVATEAADPVPVVVETPAAPVVAEGSDPAPVAVDDMPPLVDASEATSLEGIPPIVLPGEGVEVVAETTLVEAVPTVVTEPTESTIVSDELTAVLAPNDPTVPTVQ
jgi:hypothetical protein